MRFFRTETENFIKTEKTEIDADVSASSDVSITVLNTDGFSNNDFVVVGNIGNDKAEVAQINAAISADDSFQVDELQYDHDEEEPINKIRFNQRKLYGATEKTGSYSVVTSGTSSPKDIEVDNPQGTYFEYTGTTYTWFKSTYYNSETTDETSLSDAKAGSVSDTAVYASVSDVREKAGFSENSYISDGRIADERNYAQSLIEGTIQDKYNLPLDPVPDVIEDICIRLAAGRLINDVLSGGEQGSEMIKEAKADLMDIVDGEVKLLDADGNDMTASGTSDFQGEPNSSSDDAFSMSDRY